MEIDYHIIKKRWAVFKIMTRLKYRLMKEYSSNGVGGIEARDRTRIRFQLSSVSMLMQLSTERSTIKIIPDFLRSCYVRRDLAHKIQSFSIALRKVVEKIREQLMYQEQRSKALHSYFQKEVDHYAVLLTKSEQK